MPRTAREKNWDPHSLCRELERAVNEASDITAVYLTVGRLNDVVASHPGCVTHRTVAALAGLLADTRFEANKLAYFLYRSIAETLVEVMVRRPFDPPAAAAATHLKRTVETGTGVRHRAASEALGSLPVDVSGPSLEAGPPEKPPSLTFRDAVRHGGNGQGVEGRPPVRIGRSWTVPAPDREHLIVIKAARTRSDAAMLNREAAWMDFLRHRTADFPVRFHIPRPMDIRGSRVFKLSGAPVRPSGQRRKTGTAVYAMGYIAHRDYFVYPNDHRPDHRLSGEAFCEIIFRNARLLGELAARGIVHTAPIPMFHNRLQRGRREDQGRYEWYRGGRLDRWLYSCRYPNFGKSGLRDYEHLSSFGGTAKKLYRHIGDHLLSLLLVAGSYFRNAAPRSFGYDPEGNPHDMRGLFDHGFLERIVRGIFDHYHKGFTGDPFTGWVAFPFARLAERMIEEMGVDRHMDEFLRVADQQRMSTGEFRSFLAACGFSDNRIGRINRGERDIRLATGPHLGGFNRRISLPELTEFLASAAACCMAGKHCQQRRIEAMIH
jgi:hypothetical protein